MKGEKSAIWLDSPKNYSVVEFIIDSGDYTVPSEIGWTPRLKDKEIYPGGNLRCLMLQNGQSIALVVPSVKDIRETLENVAIEEALEAPLDFIICMFAQHACVLAHTNNR